MEGGLERMRKLAAGLEILRHYVQDSVEMHEEDAKFITSDWFNFAPELPGEVRENLLGLGWYEDVDREGRWVFPLMV